MEGREGDDGQIRDLVVISILLLFPLVVFPLLPSHAMPCHVMPSTFTAIACNISSQECTTSQLRLQHGATLRTSVYSTNLFCISLSSLESVAADIFVTSSISFKPLSPSLP